MWVNLFAALPFGDVREDGGFVSGVDVPSWLGSGLTLFRAVTRRFCQFLSESRVDVGAFVHRCGRVEALRGDVL
jgi:hypothetical protein